MYAFGKPIAVEYTKGKELTEGIWNLSQCSEGDLFPCHCDPIASTVHADVMNREIMAVMGFKLFYGLHPTGSVVEFMKKGRISQRDMARIREIGIEKLWWSTFTAKTWLIDGEEVKTEYHADLSPVETTIEAARWGRALGRY